MMESIKKALIPFIPPPMRGLTCNSVFILFEAIVKALKFLFQQFFFVHRVKFIFFIAWLVVWLIAIHRYDFGALYFMISTLIFMLYNLGSRKDGTLSAYSVFNPRGVRLLGQLDASNFGNTRLKKVFICCTCNGSCVTHRFYAFASYSRRPSSCYGR